MPKNYKKLTNEITKLISQNVYERETSAWSKLLQTGKVNQTDLASAYGTSTQNISARITKYQSRSEAPAVVQLPTVVDTTAVTPGHDENRKER